MTYFISKKFNIENFIELLKEETDDNIINLVAIMQEKSEMKKREEILSSHPYKIYQDKAGKWYTYLPDENEGRRRIKRSTESAIQTAIVEFYKEQEKEKAQNVYEFVKCWDEWRERQQLYGVSNNTLTKYDSDYRRFFAEKDFVKRDIRYITEEDITAFMISTIRTLKLKEKAGKALWGYITGVFKIARIRKKIKEDPCNYVDTKMFHKFYDKSKQSDEHRYFNDIELTLLKKQIKADHDNKPLYIQPYAIELAMFTGMRVGELAGLKWKNVSLKKEVIIISESEKFDRITKEHYVSDTKNGKTRVFPITEEMRRFFMNLKKLQLQNGISGEYVFANEKGKITARSISECLRYKCKQVNIDEKGIHALRRTLNSKMRCNGVSTTVAASLLGHTERVNQTNYTYDITEMNYKREAVAKAVI